MTRQVSLDKRRRLAKLSAICDMTPPSGRLVKLPVWKRQKDFTIFVVCASRAAIEKRRNEQGNNKTANHARTRSDQKTLAPGRSLNITCAYCHFVLAWTDCAAARADPYRPVFISAITRSYPAMCVVTSLLNIGKLM